MFTASKDTEKCRVVFRVGTKDAKEEFAQGHVIGAVCGWYSVWNAVILELYLFENFWC